MIEEKIDFLKSELLQFANLVETMIEESIRGLLERNGELLEKVREKSEPKANDFELHLDELCTNLIAQFEPRAKNLRVILMILKMGNDLERIGDHAVNVAQSAQFLIGKPTGKDLTHIPRMSEEAIRMLKDVIQAFVREDVRSAKEVCERDSLVDTLNSQIIRELIGCMTKDPTTVERSMQLIRISQNLERIADLSTNMGEDIVFMVEGQVIKHHHEEEKR